LGAGIKVGADLVNMSGGLVAGGLGLLCLLGMGGNFFLTATLRGDSGGLVNGLLSGLLSGLIKVFRPGVIDSLT